MHIFKSCLPLLLSFVSFCLTAHADVHLPGIFTDHMVLQREQINPVWGTADADEVVTVQIGGQSHSTVADADGNWRVDLTPLEVGGPYTLHVAGDNAVTFEDVLVGEVWFCSGQSNMELNLDTVNHADVELADANNAQIRLFTVKKVATQELQDDLGGEWVLSTSASAGQFSAVGYLFGKRLQHILNVPIGLIDNSWSGSAAAAWVSREALESSEVYDEMLSVWDERAGSYSDEIHAEKLAAYEAWVAAGRPDPAVSWPNDPRYSQNRPANIYNGSVYPLAGYGIRGVIWYQGESDAWQAALYRELFPLLITTWRNLWQQGDFSFYWVQLADYQNEVTEPGDSHWAELREAQTMTLSLPNTGETVIIDAGEGRDIHPRDKQTVANRLVRHALAKDYGFDIASDSPRYASMSISGNTVTVKFDHVATQLYAFDSTEVKGFSIAGEDQQYVWAEAKIVGKDSVEVWSDSVANPVAVRYAWSSNPVANLQDRNGLQVTPFRTNDWAPVSSSPDAPVIQIEESYQVTLPAKLNPLPVILDASPLDQLTISWEQVSGPSGVSFSDIHSVDPEVTFAQSGNYLLRLSVADSVHTSAVFIEVEVARLPFPYGLPGSVFLGQSDFISHNSSQDLSGGIIVDSDASA
ncbi:sialate O-acetylesterase, partial [Coraliomargarita sp. SDUM461004]